MFLVAFCFLDFFLIFIVFLSVNRFAFDAGGRWGSHKAGTFRPPDLSLSRMVWYENIFASHRSPMLGRLATGSGGWTLEAVWYVMDPPVITCVFKSLLHCTFIILSLFYYYFLLGIIRTARWTALSPLG